MDPPSPLLLAHELLPLIFSPSGVPVPPRLLSTPTRQAHHFLTSTPNDPLAYWQPITLRKDVEEERLDYVQSGSFGDLLPSTCSYTISPPDIKALIPLGHSNLSLVLLYEARHLAARPPGIADAQTEDTDGPPAWGFLELTATASARDSVHGGWFGSMGEAVEAVRGMDLGGEGEAATPEREARGSGGGRRGSIGLGVSGAGGPEEDEMEDGEGNTPGAYGQPEDFWAGYSDDDDKTDTEQAPAASAEETNEDDYWARYGNEQQDEGLANDRNHIRHLSRITEGDEDMVDLDVSSPVAPSEADSEASLPPIPLSPVRSDSAHSTRTDSSSGAGSSSSTLNALLVETASRVSLHSPTSPMSPMSKSRLFAPLPPAPGPSQLRNGAAEQLVAPDSPSTTPRVTPLRSFSSRESLTDSPGPSRNSTPRLSQTPLPATSSPRVSLHSSAPPATASPNLSQLRPLTISEPRLEPAPEIPTELASPAWPPTPGSISAYSVMTDPRHSVALVHAPLEEVWRGYRREGVDEEEREEDERLRAALRGVWAVWTRGRKGGESGEVGGRTFGERWRRVTDEVALE